MTNVISRSPVCLRCLLTTRTATHSRISSHSPSSQPWLLRTLTNARPRNAKVPPPASRAPQPTNLPKTSPPRTPRPPEPISPGGPPILGVASKWDRLFASGDKVLLFKSANHTSFFVHAYVLGGLLIFGAYNYAANVSQPLAGEEEPRPLPIWVKATVYGSAAFIAVFGTVVLMAPLRLLKSVTAVAKRTPGKPSLNPHLVCEIKAPLPFMRAKTIEVPASEAYMNRNLPYTQLDLIHVPMAVAGQFTSDYLRGGKRTTARDAEPRGMGQSLLNFWPNIKHETRRLILRDGFARLQFEGRGGFKIDLHGCELLDHGQPFALLTSPTPEGSTGSFASIRRWLSSSL